mmetsp:Transcript_3302/g.4486  ORF Transcript_3302/g.4486 Transcript_3302/m.4486 type:complete len:242 (-) Transcript_3302:990-1715(-)
MVDKLSKSLDEIWEEKSEKWKKRQGSEGNVQRNSRQRNRSHPYRRNYLKEKTSRKGPRILKVSGDSNVRSVAGGIAGVCRSGLEAPIILATGPTAINQAVKAISIARGFLCDDNLDLRAKCEFEDIKGFKTKIKLSKAASKPRAPKISEDDLYVLPKSDAFKVAGAIAARIRESRHNPTSSASTLSSKAVGILAKGSAAVSIMIKSISVARGYLDEENIDILFVPIFVEKETVISSNKGRE